MSDYPYYSVGAQIKQPPDEGSGSTHYPDEISLGTRRLIVYNSEFCPFIPDGQTNPRSFRA